MTDYLATEVPHINPRIYLTSNVIFLISAINLPQYL